jgi:lysylphosphatidylglycerol synthase-like protein
MFFILLSWSLYRQIINQNNLQHRWAEIKSSWNNLTFLLVVLLMFLNWGIEAFKWQLLIRHLQPFSFFTSFKSVLAGSSVTMLTPNRVGEYGGRILYIEEDNRIQAISLAIVGSISQLLVTLVMGCFGFLFLRFVAAGDNNVSNLLPQPWLDVVLYLSTGITIVVLLFYLRLGSLVRMIEGIGKLKKITRYIKVLDEIPGKQLLQVLSLSFCRYLVFVLQYILLIKIMHIDISAVMCFWLVSIFYLVIAIAPTIGFIELPLRVTASWEIFKFYTSNELGVGAAGLGIWLINLVIPAIIGSLLILSVKIVNEK